MAKQKFTTEQLSEMTKDQLAEFAKEHSVTVKGIKDIRKADLVAIIAENVNKTVRGRKNRIKAAALALIQARGVDQVTLAEFIDTVLAVYPEWDKANDEPVAKKHLSWYKSFYRKNVLGQLARPRKAKTADATPAGNATTQPIELAAAPEETVEFFGEPLDSTTSAVADSQDHEPMNLDSDTDDTQHVSEPTSAPVAAMQC